MFIRSRPGAITAFIAMAITPPVTFAADATSRYPDRPIRVIVPFPPGGGTDIVSRIIQPAWSARMGQQIVLDNRGGAQRLLGNEVQVLFSGPGAALPQIKAGRIRALAVTTLKRSRELPNVHTLNELGFKGFEISGWYGLMAPAAAPKAAITRLNAKLVKILSGGEVAQQLMTRGYDPAPTTPEEFGKYLRSEVARWSKAVKEYGIKSTE